jgi:hypothetical protein
VTEFDYEGHLTKGDATAARSWIESSTLPEEQKADLQQFVANFPSLTFAKEDDAILDHYAETDGVELPPWLREVRSTLAFTDPPVLFRVDDFQWYDSPRCEAVDHIWYELRFGYSDEEDRARLRDRAKIYPIGGWFGSDRSYLGVDLQNPEDRRIFDFSGEDLIDDELDDEPLRDSLFPIFSSYARFLARIAEVRVSDDAT